MKNKQYGLDYKFTKYLLISLVISVAIGLIVVTFGNIYVKKIYNNDAAYEKYIDSLNVEFLQFIEDNHIKSDYDGKNLIKHWSEKNKYVSLYMVKDYSVDVKSSVEEQVYNLEDFELFSEDDNVWSYDPATSLMSSHGYDYELADGVTGMSFYLLSNSYAEYRVRIVIYIGVSISVIIFIIMMLRYITQNNQRIKIFRDEMDLLSGGESIAFTMSEGDDELGDIANSAMELNSGLMESYKREERLLKELVQGQRQMAHDIRTPLTVISGNLDLIREQIDDKNQIYIDKCMERIDQINDMINKLIKTEQEIKYNQLDERNDEKERSDHMYNTEENDYTCGDYLESMVMQLEIAGYIINISDENNTLKKEIKGNSFNIRRIFDNILSNVLKYSDKTYPIEIDLFFKEKQMLIITITDTVLKRNEYVVSNGYGENICKELLHNMGGNYFGKQQNDKYVVTVELYLDDEK